MKKFLAVAAVLAATTAQAEELKFGDLNYFLKQGQFNVTADWIVHNETARADKTDDLEIDAYLIQTKLAYGIANNLNAFVGFDYTFDGKVETNSRQYDTDGLQNPKLGANLRILNQNNAGFNLDVGAVASLQLMDRELGSSRPNKSGNLFDPQISNYDESRSNLELNVRLGNKWNEANEFYLTGAVVYNKDGEFEARGSGEDVELEDSLDFKLGAFYQYRPVMEFMMTLGVEATRKGQVDGEVDGNDITYNDHLDYKFIFNAKYFVSESFVAKFVFTKDKREEFDFESDFGDSKIDKRNALQYGLGVDFLF